MSPFIFNIFIDFVARCIIAEAPAEGGVSFAYKVDGKLIPISSDRYAALEALPMLMYADDIAILAHSFEAVTALLLKAEEVTQRWAFTINVGKTKVLRMGKPGLDCQAGHITLRGEEVEMVDHFCYLGSTVTSDASIDRELKKRLAVAGSVFNSMRNRFWREHALSLKSKAHFFRSCVLPTLLYGCETWTLLDPQVDKLEAFLNNCIRCVLGVSLLDKVKVSVLRSLFDNQPSISSLLLQARMRLLGSIARMGPERLPKQLLFGTFMSKRPVGRPRMTFNAMLHKDFDVLFKHNRDVPKLNCHIRPAGWYDLCLDKSKWTNLVNKAASAGHGSNAM
jgi:hypothetical protein